MWVKPGICQSSTFIIHFFLEFQPILNLIFYLSPQKPFPPLPGFSTLNQESFAQPKPIFSTSC